MITDELLNTRVSEGLKKFFLDYISEGDVTTILPKFEVQSFSNFADKPTTLVGQTFFSKVTDTGHRQRLRIDFELAGDESINELLNIVEKARTPSAKDLLIEDCTKIIKEFCVDLENKVFDVNMDEVDKYINNKLGDKDV